MRRGHELTGVKGVLAFDLLTCKGVEFISSDQGGNEVEGLWVTGRGVHVLHLDNNHPGSDNEFTVSHYLVDPRDEGLP